MEGVIGTQNSLDTKDSGAKKESSLVIRKIPARQNPAPTKIQRGNSPLIRRQAVRENSLHKKDVDAKKDSPILIRKISMADPSIHAKTLRELDNRPLIRKQTVKPKPYNTPAWNWPEKPVNVFLRQRVLILRGLPLATTLQAIILSIDKAIHNHQVLGRPGTARIADIVIRPGTDSSKEVEAVIEFIQADGARILRDLAVKKQFKVLGVVPDASLDEPREPTEVPQPHASGGDKVIAQLTKAKRAELFESPELRKIVRRTHLIYN
jgi:hypothetical protein